MSFPINHLSVTFRQVQSSHAIADFQVRICVYSVTTTTTTISDNQLSAPVLLNHIHTMELTKVRARLTSMPSPFLTIQKCMKGEGWANLVSHTGHLMDYYSSCLDTQKYLQLSLALEKTFCPVPNRILKALTEWLQVCN